LLKIKINNYKIFKKKYYFLNDDKLIIRGLNEKIKPLLKGV